MTAKAVTKPKPKPTKTSTSTSKPKPKPTKTSHTSADRGFQVTHAVVTTAGMSDRIQWYDLIVEYGSDLTLRVTGLKTKYPHQGVFKCRPMTSATSMFMLFNFDSASANGKLLALKMTSTPAVRRIDGAWLPVIATNLLEQRTVKLTLACDRYTLRRESNSTSFDVRLTCNGKRMKVPCVVFSHDDGEALDSAIYVASEGPLRGMPLLVRHEGSAMRVTVVDGHEMTT
jgi:hypothetical protein